MLGTQEKCVRLVSLKKEVTYFHETLSKFKGKENLNLILSSQMSFLNKIGLGFKPDGAPSKCLNNKKKNLTIYKCSHC